MSFDSDLVHAHGHGFASVAQVRLRGGMELLGPIVRLQVQTASLKCGDRLRRWYDPAPIQAVERLRLDDGGAWGIEAGAPDLIGDVHHRDHAASKYRGENGLSFGFTSHYEVMREQFGAHLVDGIAGENILIASQRHWTLDDVQHGIVIVAADEAVELAAIEVAPPCAEFSKFALRYPPERVADRTVTDAITFLHNGVRGYYAALGESFISAGIAVGDLVYRRETS